ncbi:MAG: hypothetical protein Q4E28_04885 [Clostridia bacterium]|nr:hypothetical protein [Clostridia bacterium]
MEIKINLDEKMINSRMAENPRVLSNLLTALYNLESGFNSKAVKTQAPSKPADANQTEKKEQPKKQTEISIDVLRKEFASVAKKGKKYLPMLEGLVKEFSENDTLSGIPKEKYQEVITRLKEIK